MILTILRIILILMSLFLLLAATCDFKDMAAGEISPGDGSLTADIIITVENMIILILILFGGI